MASVDYLNLRKLLNSGYSPVSVNISINQSGEATVKLSDVNGVEKVFVSSESDFAKLAFSLHFSYTTAGEGVFGEVKDLEKYYKNAEMFFDPDKKRLQEAREKLILKKISMEYVPYKLLTQFLEEKNPNNYKKYIQLRDDYYPIQVLQVEEMKEIFTGIKVLEAKNNIATKIYKLTGQLFMKAFHQDKNFLKNYKNFHKFIDVDLMQLLVDVVKDSDHREDLFRMLHQRGGMPAENGLRHLIEQYSTMAESIHKLLNVVRGAIEINNGNPNPDLVMRSTENYKIIKESSLYSFIVEDFDPRIRHGKAHNNYQIDTNKRLINFYTDGRIRKLSVSYTFDEFRAMWKRIPYILTGLTVAACGEQSALTGVVLRSVEYKQLLASLDTFKQKISK